MIPVGGIAALLVVTGNHVAEAGLLAQAVEPLALLRLVNLGRPCTSTRSALRLGCPGTKWVERHLLDSGASLALLPLSITSPSLVPLAAVDLEPDPTGARERVD